MTSTARNFNYGQDNQNEQNILDKETIESWGNNLGIEFAAKHADLLKSPYSVMKLIKTLPDFANVDTASLEALASAVIIKAKQIIELESKATALQKAARFESERFVRTMNGETIHAANDNASITQRIKKIVGISKDFKTKNTPHNSGEFSTEAANDVDMIKENDALRDDSYFQARTLSRIQGNLRELTSEALISEKAADGLTAGFNLMREKMGKVSSVIDDYEKILLATAGYDPSTSSQLRTLMVTVDVAYYKAPSDPKYTNAYLLQAELEKGLMTFENNLRTELDLDQNNEDAELDDKVPSSGVELLDFQKRQTRISELTAGIEELIKEYRRRNTKSIEAQKKDLSKHSDRIKKEKSAVEKRAEKWEDVRENEVMRVFWYEFGNKVLAIKQHRANLARISAKGRDIYEKHLNSVMSDYLDLREEVAEFEEQMKVKGFSNCLESEFGKLALKNSVSELAKVRAEIRRAKALMTPRKSYFVETPPSLFPPQIEDNDVPDSGPRVRQDRPDNDTDAFADQFSRMSDQDRQGANDNFANGFNDSLPAVNFDSLTTALNSELKENQYRADIVNILNEFKTLGEDKYKHFVPVLDELNYLQHKAEVARSENDSSLKDIVRDIEAVQEKNSDILSEYNRIAPWVAFANSIDEEVTNLDTAAKPADLLIKARYLKIFTELEKRGLFSKSLDEITDTLVVCVGNKLNVPAHTDPTEKIKLIVDGKHGFIKIDRFGIPHLFLVEADGKEIKVLNSVEKKAQEEAQKAAEEKARQEEAQRLAKEALANAEAARIAAEKAEADRLAIEAANAAEKARKDAEAAALGDPDKVINDTKGRIDKGIETKEVLIPAEALYLGDLHGNYRVFEETVVNVLKLATKGADGNLVWMGGNRKFNDLGDIVFDRVTESFPILRQIRNLRMQAVKEGGRVEVVAGNHEDFAIGFFMGGTEMLEAFRNAMRLDSSGKEQGAGIYEFFAKYTAMGKHHSQYEGVIRDGKKTLPETEATLWEKLTDLRKSTRILEELDAYRKEILANMAKDVEGLEILEEMARLNLVLADDGVSVSIHTEPTDQILASLTHNTNERVGVEKNVAKLNAKFKALLKKLFLEQVNLSDEERAELNQLRSTFIYTDNRNFKAYYEAGQIDTNNLKALAEAGYKTIVHGHTDLNYAISFRTAEGINIVNIDRSVGKTAGTGVGIESSTAVMYKDGKIETGLPDYKNLEKFNYTTKATADWLEEVFSLAPEASVSAEAQKLTDEIGAIYPEEIGARLNKDALKYLISTFAVGNKMDDSQKLPLKAELIKSLVDLYHEWIADDLRTGEDIKKIVAEMVALKAPIDELAARWRAKKVKEQEKPKNDEKSKEDDKEAAKADMEVKDDTVVSFSSTKVNKLYNKLTDAEHTQNQIDALAAFSKIFGKLSEMQIKALADAIDALHVSVQKRIVYNIVNFTSTINTIFTGEMSGVRVFGAVKGLPKNVTLFEVVGGLEAKSLDILKDTTKLEMATRALSSLNGKTIAQVKKMVQPAFKSKTVLEWLTKLK